MKFDEAKQKEGKYYSSVFTRLPLLLVRGEGMYVWDGMGRQYLDLCSGVAVNSVGHCHPDVVREIIRQSSNLMHTSNWFYTMPQLELAETLASLTGLEKTFLTNSGTESVEAALKLAKSATGKKEVIAMKGAFHGRTMGSLAVTWPEKYRKPFEPGVPGTKFVEYNNPDAVSAAITPNTAAVIVEPIQGEAGIIAPDDGYLKALRDITADKSVLLIVDEIQTGFGRTGSMFAFQQEKITPDILCLAKALGAGTPIGAIQYSGIDFKPGEHGGTLGGNPVACAAANAAIAVIRRDKLAENAKKMGGKLMKDLAGMGLSPRGRGLMIAVPLKEPLGIVEKLIEKYVITIPSPDSLRLLPPLIIEEAHADNFLSVLGEILGLTAEIDEAADAKGREVSAKTAAAEPPPHKLDKMESRLDPAVVERIVKILLKDVTGADIPACKSFVRSLLLGEKKLSAWPNELSPDQYNAVSLILDDYFAGR